VIFGAGIISFNTTFMNINKKDSIVLYTDKRGNVELRADVDKDTLWATQDQLARLFDVTIPNVSMHIKNIFKTRELRENSVVKDFLITAEDGKVYSHRLYNLDVIIAVGYRVNSKKATKFRIWATRILRQYLVKGFNLDERKLTVSSDRLDDLHEAIRFIESKPEDGHLKAKITVRMTKDLIK
jgi:hypothetical protein